MLALLAPGGCYAGGWEIGAGASPEVTLEMNTLGPSPQIPGTTGIWALYSPSLSVECSPPRGCYAKTQRIYYAFNCSPRYAAAMERISMDLNGTEIKRELRDTSLPYSPGDDAGAIKVLETLCPLPERDRRR